MIEVQFSEHWPMYQNKPVTGKTDKYLYEKANYTEYSKKLTERLLIQFNLWTQGSKQVFNLGKKKIHTIIIEHNDLSLKF